MLNQDLSHEIQSRVDNYLHNYSVEELWKILEVEWKDAEIKVSPKRSNKKVQPKIEKFIIEVKQKIALNQALMPSTASALTGFVISQIETTYPWVIQFKIPLSILVAIVVQSIQSTWISTEVSSKSAKNK